jgi:hypothetical protein
MGRCLEGSSTRPRVVTECKGNTIHDVMRNSKARDDCIRLEHHDIYPVVNNKRIYNRALPDLLR